MAILIDSGTPASDKNFWATTPECFADGQALYGRPFAVDVCAEPLTAKCQSYYGNPALYDLVLDYRTSADTLALMRESGRTCLALDALAVDWPEHWWCNPPFDQKLEFIAQARRQQAAGRPGMMLLPYEPLTGWWTKRLSFGCIIYEPDGRYQFCERDGVTKKQGANFGSALVVFPTLHIAESPRIRFERGIGLLTQK